MESPVKQSFITEFRNLQKELGENESDALMSFLIKYNEILMNNLVTKADFEKGKVEFQKEISGVSKEISGLAWKMAALLLGQGALIITLMKFLS